MSYGVVKAQFSQPAVSSLRTTVVTSFSQLEEFSAEWQRLWSTDQKREIFNSYAWVCAWWKANGEGKSLCVLLVYEGESAVGILPLVRHGSKVSFLGDPENDYNDIICAPGWEVAATEAALQSLFTTDVPWSYCVLRDVPEQSHLRAALARAGSPFRRWVHMRRGTPCPTLLFQGNKQELVTTIIAKDRFRKDKKKLSKLGVISFGHLQSKQEIRRHLPEFLRQYWRRRALAGQFSPARYTALQCFYEALVDELDPRSELRFAVMQVGGRSLAYHFGFETNGKFVLYKPTFDVDFWDYSAGSVLVACLIEYASKDGILEFDFTRGDEPYKNYFANHTKYNWDISIERPGLAGWVRHTGRLVHAAALRAVQGGRLEPTLRQLQGISPFRRQERKSQQKNGLFGRMARGALLDARTRLLFRSEATGCAPANPPGSNFALRQGSLGDVADFALQQFAIWDSNSFADLRSRFKSGHTMYVAAEGERIATLAWVKISNGGSGGLQTGDPVVPPAPVAIIYDLWTHPDGGHAALGQLLAHIVAKSHPEGREVFIDCAKGDVALRGQIEAAGFRLHSEVLQVCLFRWMNWSRRKPAN